MKNWLLGLVCCVSVLWCDAAVAADMTNKTVSVENPWARASAGMARAGAAFMVLHNSALEDDAIVSAEANVSKVVELHTHIHDNGVMRMRKVDQIKLPAKGEAVLKPGGLHVMFIGLHQPLVKGQTFNVKLNFAHAASVTVPVVVRGVGAR